MSYFPVWGSNVTDQQSAVGTNSDVVDQHSDGGSLKAFMHQSVRKAAGKVANRLASRMKEKNKEEERRMNHPGANKRLPESYSYHPVDFSNRQIRLLRIRPDTKHDDSRKPKPIRVELSHVYLDAQPRYTALSYTWGAPDQFPIWIDGRVFHVGENLHAALRWLRGHIQPDRYLWIDAICICQRDNVEKSAQVSLMGHIYKTAEEVLIWLGYKYEWQLKVIASIGMAAESAGVWDIGHVARKEINQLNKPILDLMNNVRTGKLTGQPGYRQDPSRFDPFWTFLELPQCPWFTRVWVLQEVALARRATLASRSAMAPFSALVSALKLLDIWLDWNPRELINYRAKYKYSYRTFKSEEKMREVRREMVYQEPPSVTLWKYFSPASSDEKH